MEDMIGKIIDRYKIVSELGRGGMAVVYRAVDTMLDRSVAIKIISPDTNEKAKSIKRFYREATTLAKLSHVNIVKVMDFGEFEGSPYLVMEYLPGGTLKSKIGEPWNYADAAAMLVPIARALGYAHTQKVIHRDIKPANILLNETGQPLLSDFGILKLVDPQESQGLTGTGKIVGTPTYMSPEQIRGKEIDGRADIYSLGIVFFEMITGQKPYTANTPIEVSIKHLNDPIPNAKQFVRDLPPEVEQVLLKAMAKKPEDRYQTSAAMADALEKLSKKQTGGSNQATKITNEFNKPKEKRLKASLVKFSAIGVIAILVVVSLFFLIRQATGRLPGEMANGAAGNQTPTATQQVESSTDTPPAPPAFTLVPTTTETPFTLEPSPTPTEQAFLIHAADVPRIIEVNRLEGISVKKLDWMKNGEWIINSGSYGISFINPKTMAIDKKIAMPNDLPISMAISPSNDKVFVLASTKVIVIDIPKVEIKNEFSIIGGAYSIASSKDGKLIALGMMDNKVQLVNAEDGSVVQNLRSNFGGWSVAFSPDSRIVAGGTSQGSLMWETATGIWLPLAARSNNVINCLVFSRDGKLLAGGSEGEIFIWDVTSGKLITQITREIGTINSLDFSPDNTILVSGSDDPLIRFWDPISGAELGSLKGHTSPVFSTVFSPNGDFIVSGAEEGTIRIWGIP